MKKMLRRSMGVILIGLMLFSAEGLSRAAQPSQEKWLKDWQQKNAKWTALHLFLSNPEQLPDMKRLIADVLAPRGFNVLIAEVNYDFQFKSHPELECRGWDKEQVRDLAATCRANGVRLIALFNCLGHQSHQKGVNVCPLLKKYPQFEQPPVLPEGDPKFYCREWCPSNTDLYPIVFDLLDELIDAFDADAFHVGMDETFLLNSKNCPQCKDKDAGDLFAGVANRLHGHIVGRHGIEMLMWGDRLIESSLYYGSVWEASNSGSHRAIDKLPRDIIICDWHYDPKDDYPPIRYFQEKGFRVLPATWKKPDGAVALIRCSRRDATERMLGILFTGWSTNAKSLRAALSQPMQSDDKTPSDPKRATGDQTARQIADTINAGLGELSGDGKPK